MAYLIIAGFSGIGKTTLGKKYKNVIDLDSAEYAYDDTDISYLSLEQRKGMSRKKNKNWPENYIKAINEAKEKYDYVLVWDRLDIINEYIKNNIDFILCYPSYSSLDIYKQRYKDRGNSNVYIEKKIKEYDEKMKFFNKLNVEKIVLDGNDTLENYLLRKGYNLIKK